MNFDDEISSAFRDIDEAVAEPFTYAAGTFVGIFAANDLATQMLTGNYQSVSTLKLRAHKAQFPAPPAARSGELKRLKDNTGWAVLDIDPHDTTHYVFTIKRQITP